MTYTEKNDDEEWVVKRTRTLKETRMHTTHTQCHVRHLICCMNFKLTWTYLWGTSEEVKTEHLTRRSSHSSSSRLVATSWACLSVALLFLTDWRRNRGSPASIPAVVAGLAEWLSSPRSQVIEPKRSPANTRRSTFLHGETVSVPTSTTRPPLPRLTTQTPWMREWLLPLFTQEREVNPFSDSVHRQAAASGSSNPQEPASFNVMHERRCGKLQHCVHDHAMHVGSCGKLQRCDHVVRCCGKLQRSDCSEVETSKLNGKRDRAFGCVSSQEQEWFLLEKQNLHDYLEREAQRALPGES